MMGMVYELPDETTQQQALSDAFISRRYGPTSMTRTSLGPRKSVIDDGTSSQ